MISDIALLKGFCIFTTDQSIREKTKHKVHSATNILMKLLQEPAVSIARTRSKQWTGIRSFSVLAQCLATTCIVTGALYFGIWGSSIAATNAELQTLNTSNNQRHVYIIGCGHSGTSFLLRTIGNLPGVMCIDEESNIWLSNKEDMIQNVTEPLTVEEERKITASLSEWDTESKTSGFFSWVEKTPRHVHHMGRIFKLDPEALVIFMVRDGRDVALSINKRGYPFELSMKRWIADNTAAIPYLDDPRVMIVKFEELMSFEGAPVVMKRLAEFLKSATGGQLAEEGRLMMSMLPPTGMMMKATEILSATANLTGMSAKLCYKYKNEQEKAADLVQAQLKLMAGSFSEKSGDAPRHTDHERLRSWQMMQPWFSAKPSWPTKLAAEKKEAFMNNAEAVALLRRFGYKT